MQLQCPLLLCVEHLAIEPMPTPMTMPMPKRMNLLPPKFYWRTNELSTLPIKRDVQDLAGVGG